MASSSLLPPSGNLIFRGNISKRDISRCNLTPKELFLERRTTILGGTEVQGKHLAEDTDKLQVWYNSMIKIQDSVIFFGMQQEFNSLGT